MRAWSLLLLAAGLSQAAAQHTHQPDAAQAGRDIPALSASQLADIQSGRGAGLAVPAEVNRHPGPMHLLEHAEALGLSAGQREAVEALMAPMRRAAIEAGARFIEAERRLNALFVDAVATPDAIRQAAAAAGHAHAEMRAVHLVAHIASRALLSPAQLARYDTLRGHRPG